MANAATIQLLITATVEALDLIGRLAERQFDSREELDAYIAKRNELRERLVSLSLELGGQDPQEQADEPTSAPELGTGGGPTEQFGSGPNIPQQSNQEDGDAASSASPQD
jgi:hypothetical protein